MDPYKSAFLASRSSVIDLTEQFDDSAWNQVSPLNPEWRVRDVLGHLCGVSEDIAVGNFPTGDIDEWANAHVARHRDDSLAKLVEIWTSTGVEENFSEPFGQMLFDQISHEFDIRYALGAPGDHASPGVTLATKFASRLLRGDRAFTLTMDDEVVTARGVEPSIVITCSHFEWLRASTGRRSRAQVESLVSEPDRAYVMATLFGDGPFSPSTFDVHED